MRMLEEKLKELCKEKPAGKYDFIVEYTVCSIELTEKGREFMNNRVEQIHERRKVYCLLANEIRHVFSFDKKPGFEVNIVGFRESKKYMKCSPDSVLNIVLMSIANELARIESIPDLPQDFLDEFRRLNEMLEPFKKDMLGT